MIRKDYLIESSTAQKQSAAPCGINVKQEILALIEKAFCEGAIVEIKIVETDAVNSEGKNFSKLRLDITSNTSFDQFLN